MREAYRRVHKDAAAGVDGVTTARYGAELEANLSSLLERFVSGRYRAPTVCRVHLEKPGTSKTRPIGIPTLQDKVLQRAVLMVLESVYERELLECSNGFRPGAVRARATVRPAGGGADRFRRRSDDSTGPNGLVQDAELHLLRFPSAGRTVASVRSPGDGGEESTDPGRPRSGRGRKRRWPGDDITRPPNGYASGAGGAMARADESRWESPGDTMGQRSRHHRGP